MVHDERLHQRIRAEYHEMPGLRLTLAQAARLFNLDRRHCEDALMTLVRTGVLWTDGREFLVRDAGRRAA